jgi:hypothetical protein
MCGDDNAKDPWETCDPWATFLTKKLEAVKNYGVGNEILLPPCPPPPFVPPGPHIEKCEDIKCCEDEEFEMSKVPHLSSSSLSELRPDAQPFMPTPLTTTSYEFVQDSREILKSALQLIETQNATIAQLMQLLQRASKEPDPKNSTSKDEIVFEEKLEAAKQEWKAEMENQLLPAIHKSMREVLDVKDKKIANLREALIAAKSCDITTQPGDLHQPDMSLRMDAGHDIAGSQCTVARHEALAGTSPAIQACTSPILRSGTAFSGQRMRRHKFKLSHSRQSHPGNECEESCEYIPIAGKTDLFESMTAWCAGRCDHCNQGISIDEDAWWCHHCKVLLHAASFADCKYNHCNRKEEP